jgi:mannosyl-3-phosphoglycerate phosphatase
MRTVIFSDLDGTLLDENYSFEFARPVIARLKALNVPIVLCSSKTRIELEYFRTKLGIDAPFISENGAAIFIPKGYFNLENCCNKQTNQYFIVELGMEYSSIRKKLEGIKKTCTNKIIGFGDMTIEELARDTGLTIELAELAKQREYDEPFRIEGDEKQVFEAMKNEGLYVTKADKYYHLSGDHNKGSAVALLKKLYVDNFGRIRTIGVGNSHNDLAMLRVVDAAFFVDKKGGLSDVWKRIDSCF